MTSLMETIAVVAALGILASLLLLWFFRRRYVSRISKLNTELQEIASTGEFKRIQVLADDHVGELETTVNKLFDAVEGGHATVAGQALFSQLAAATPQPVFVHTEAILFANTLAAEKTGMSVGRLVGGAMLDVVHPDSRELALKTWHAVMSGTELNARANIRFLSVNEGQHFWGHILVRPIEDYKNKRALLTIVGPMMQNMAEDSHSRARVTLESIGDGVITTDLQGRIEYMNKAAEQLTGIERSAGKDKPISEIISLIDESSRKPLQDPVQICLGEDRRVNLGRRALLLPRSGDCEYSIELTASPVRNGVNPETKRAEIIGAVVVLHDVSELRGLSRQDSYQASHDALTGLFNRREFERRLDEILQDAHTGGTGHVLCYLDLDRFKAVNDTCGHMAGDNMLREVAGIIKDKVRDSDSVGRLGGDEFGMLLVGCPLPKAQQIADDVCNAVREYRFIWRDKIFDIGVSIGLVEISQESGTVFDALSAADSACYVAKQRGRGLVHVYSAKDEAVARQRGEIQWLQKLQLALKEDRFELFTQAIVSLVSNAKEGPVLEFLLRLRDENGVEISPPSFVRAAERYHLMPTIDRWVVSHALTAVRNGDIRLPDNRLCNINLSGQTIGDPQFLEYVVDCLDNTGVDPERICFEVTENSVVTNLEHAQRFIGVLHGMGCRFALDDFGSGLSSFANLKNLGMDYLKIDGSFIRTLAHDPINRAMVNAMVELARTLNIQVVAEHVEDETALSLVRQMGVDFVQGYGIERPRPLEALH